MGQIWLVRRVLVYLGGNEAVKIVHESRTQDLMQEEK